MDQQLFLRQCREQAKSKNFAADLADLLGMNLDSAYRRMRGSTALTYEDIQKICRHFKMSFDLTVDYAGVSHPFEFTSMFEHNGFDMLSYFEEIRAQLNYFKNQAELGMTIVAMDLPYFRQFGYQHLLRFKLFYWQRSVLNQSGQRQRQFDPENSNEEIERITAEIYRLYHQIDSIEIWTAETLDSTLKQIQYGLDSGYFKHSEDALRICDDLEQLIQKLEKEAEVSRKCHGKDITTQSGRFEIFQSDMLLGTNTIQLKLAEERYTYIGFNSFNSLMSRSPGFAEECQKWIEQIKAQSTLLNHGSEKLRYKFFKKLRSKLNAIQEAITSEAAQINT